jgi:hypothetical protein
LDTIFTGAPAISEALVRRFVCFSAVALLASHSLVALSDDRQKAEKQVRKIAAMATDKIGRRMVSMSLADAFLLPRPNLVEERRKFGLDYGSFFVAHQLLLQGMKWTELAAELKAGKTVWQIGEERHANWKQIAVDAKKQNIKIEDHIYRHFLNQKNSEADAQRDLIDRYDLAHDAVPTDFAVSTKEMVEAQARYIFWRDEAGKVRGSGGQMTASDEAAARLDHAGAGGHDLSGGITPPAAGGLPPR